MIKPNFSESQLQQWVNTEITLNLFLGIRQMFNPVIVNLIEEYDLGWDTAYYFPWLLMPSDPSQKGCNFFIQYKLSEQLEGGPRCGESKFWHCPYFRFEIPYHTKSKSSGKYELDFHQFECLKKLADKKYNVYYATNNSVYNDELLNFAQSRSLISQIPFLDVNDINGYHEKVSFTKNSPHFLLHSEVSESRIVSWQAIEGRINNGEFTTLGVDIPLLKETIVGMHANIDRPDNPIIRKIISDNEKIESITTSEKIYAEAILLTRLMRDYFNICWYRKWM